MHLEIKTFTLNLFLIILITIRVLSNLLDNTLRRVASLIFGPHTLATLQVPKRHTYKVSIIHDDVINGQKNKYYVRFCFTNSILNIHHYGLNCNVLQCCYCYFCCYNATKYCGFEPTLTSLEKITFFFLN